MRERLFGAFVPGEDFAFYIFLFEREKREGFYIFIPASI